MRTRTCDVCEEAPGVMCCRYFGKLGYYCIGCISARMEDPNDPIEQFIVLGIVNYKRG